MPSRKILFIGAGALVAIFGGTVGYLAHYDRVTAPTLPSSSPTNREPVALAAFQALSKARCDYCHTQGAALPFYADVPGAHQLMQRDLVQGLRHFRIEAVLKALQDGTPPPEEDLARIEWVTRQGRMPPSPYTLMHWRARLGDAGRNALLTWVAATRRRYYASANVAPQFAVEPVQPIMEVSPGDAGKVELGQRLFFDTLLSGDNSVSCASCHGLGKGGADGLVTATGIRGQKGPINVPTVFNALFNKVQFWNGRAPTLAAQAAGPVMNPLEMGSHTWSGVAAKLNAQPGYGAVFLKIYGPGPIDEHRITDAIAAFEVTLSTPGSRFDRYLQGDARAINASEKRGYALFKENGCASCHVGQSLGGQGMEIMGLNGDYVAARDGKPTDADLGRYTVTHAAQDRARFKVPNLRNIALTGPYMHDGSAKTLPEAVRLMVRFQTPKGTLPDQDINDIVAFLNTLTGTWQGKPLAAKPEAKK
ncbi:MULTISPECIES: cytochrome-c peroxidase [Sphingomonas]|jgi:cytochrome c peroxidase|uniref:cytochrome-c peroxidase n=1 Tax=Sphingomonas TaxID=13687 RepID=UPI000DB4FFAB|nr:MULTISPECIES: cytochrome-c peroxidase [Sphingomonas]MDF0490176.1 cytochrome-c peroxidase [Sphingomonas pollutisoli]PZU08237.1 MAG: cytochrome-c peroxidase [Sphingomonas sp.]